MLQRSEKALSMEKNKLLLKEEKLEAQLKGENKLHQEDKSSSNAGFQGPEGQKK